MSELKVMQSMAASLFPFTSVYFLIQQTINNQGKKKKQLNAKKNM